jgi:hypothetical protein
VGLYPVAPQRLSGDTIEPSVSVPIVKGASLQQMMLNLLMNHLTPALFFVSPSIILYANAPNESFAHRTACFS